VQIAAPVVTKAAPAKV
jgi:hypothetical protein